MKRLFIGLTIGNDPHTLGIHKAAKLGRLSQIETHILPSFLTDEEKIQQLVKLKPQFIGLSYRLSPEEGLKALRTFLSKLKPSGMLNDPMVRICFAGLSQTIGLIKETEFHKQFGLTLIEPSNDTVKKTNSTLDFFNVLSEKERSDILRIIKEEAESHKLELLDHLAERVFKDQAYEHQPALRKPTTRAIVSLSHRISESRANYQNAFRNPR